MSADVVVGHLGALPGIVVKSALLYGTALILLRAGERRTLAQLNIFDVIVAVAMGAIVGRAATASTTSWVEGAVALATLIVVHRLLSWLRFLPGMRRVTDPAPRLLVHDGELQRLALFRSGITAEDVEAALRERGFHDLSEVHVAVLEGAGNLTVVRRGAGGPLIDGVIRAANQPRNLGSTSRS
ncbi:MAG TPA: YetF domain-containing protein [Mycobacteriales bacterium]|nr:YetF domain-containing protein [Mycobacteriales bacterium]